ncbi:MAG TPA: nitrilase-related carbon-nitrogen hydrolase [Baekduia sp.]|nr:nitrilase-related carbon-nitrogen hydrolase [Baekduia sp.]
MRVLLGQLDAVPGDLAANAASVAGALDAHPEAELAAFPELALTGYDLAAVERLAVPEGSPALDPIREAAQRNGTAVVVGFAERREDGTANAVACIDADGRWAATYRKVQCFDREAEHFVAGDELVVVELAGRRVAPLICFDVEFPEPARAVALAGAEVLVTVAANMEPYAPDHALAAAARALDNRRPHLYVNRVGAEAGLRFVGRSAAIGPDGEVAVRLGDQAETHVCDLPVGAPSPATDYLRLLRPTPGVNTVTSTLLEENRS